MSNIIADSTGGVTIGVSRAHYALLINDPKGAKPVYGEPKPLLNTKSVVLNSSDGVQTEYYDNAPQAVAVSKSEKTLAFTKSDFRNAELRVLLGHKKVKGITAEGGDSIAPYAAFGFSTLKSNGHERLVWLLKGMFSMSEVKADTREQNVTFQNQSINGTFITRLCDNQIKIQIDTDDPDYTEEIGAKWFTAETLQALYEDADAEDDEDSEDDETE